MLVIDPRKQRPPVDQYLDQLSSEKPPAQAIAIPSVVIVLQGDGHPDSDLRRRLGLITPGNDAADIRHLDLLPGWLPF